ncbi:sirohydrochlorin cobaltochelatase [Cellulosilyticum ruminicola]|uniref:sirohydrochlorin cobaltochelatase n=1 Tax=Cellulosilyticum ruminicola TaxID=425254 RepID=UPI0006D0276A|nr:sirohydrochlorin cobaltochelatase [Cellulosilyticum ruminicola]
MKKAVLVVSFGTSYQDTREKTIVACENKIKEAFEGYDFFRAYTSDMVIRKIAREEGFVIDNPEEALQRIYELGYEEVIVQSLHIICGDEYTKLKDQVEVYKDKFKKITLGRPLLTLINDYKETVALLKQELPELKEGEGLVFMGHGTEHPAHSAYCALDYMFDQEDMKIYVGTVEGYPEIGEVFKRLKRDHIKKIYLTPFMLVAGDHATNDMASDEEDSWKTLFEEAGYEVEIIFKGLGEYEGVQQRFITHAKESIA